MTAASNKQKTIRALALVLLGLFGRPPSVAAQAAVNPTTAQFTASSDHNATSNGTPLVQSYQLEFFIVGASAPFQTNTLGKPTPDSGGTITVDLTSMLVGWPVPGTNYVADVAAVGPGGTARSALSNTFSFCNFSLSPSSQTVAAPGGPNSTSVVTTTGCTWTSLSNNTWITIASGSSGTGNGAVNYNVAANTSTSSRSGSITAATRLLTVTQS